MRLVCNYIFLFLFGLIGLKVNAADQDSCTPGDQSSKTIASEKAPSPIQGEGTRLSSELQAIFSHYQNNFMDIREDYSDSDVSIKGKYRFSLLIDEAGNVTRCDLVPQGLESLDFAEAICEKIYRISFYPKKSSGYTEIDHEIDFSN